MKPRTFRQAFAEEAGRVLGSIAGGLPALLGFTAATFGPEIVEHWRERRAHCAVDEGQALSEECPEPADEPDYVMGTDGAGRRTLRRRPRLADQADEEPSD